MFRKYLTKDEFCEKYSPYQKGETVTVIKPIYTDDGKYETGTEFVVTNVELKKDIELPKVFSDEADNYYADKGMFRLQLKPKNNLSESNLTLDVDIKHFTRATINTVKCVKIIIAVIGLGLTIFLSYLIGNLYFDDIIKQKNYCITIFLIGFLTFIAFIVSVVNQKQTIHKKHKKY